MNAIFEKQLAIVELLEGNIVTRQFSHLEKLRLAQVVRNIDPSASDYTSIYASVLGVYRDIDTEYPMLATFDKVLLAANIMLDQTGGTVTQTPTTGSAGVKATSTLTIGGTTDSDIAEGDKINIWKITLTAVDPGEGETAGAYEFAISDDKDEVIANILAAIAAIPAGSVLPFTAEAGDSPTIVFEAKVAGVAGNAIEVSVESEGDTAFNDENFLGGVDEVKATPGAVGDIAVSGGKPYVKDAEAFVELAKQSDISALAAAAAELVKLRFFKKTIGAPGVADCDYNFATAEDMVLQSIELENILPADARLVDVIVKTEEAFTGATSLEVDAGAASGGSGMIDGIDMIAKGAVTGSTVGMGKALEGEATSLFISATPGVMWSLVEAGRLAVYVVYMGGIVDPVVVEES